VKMVDPISPHADPARLAALDRRRTPMHAVPRTVRYESTI